MAKPPPDGSIAAPTTSGSAAKGVGDGDRLGVGSAAEPVLVDGSGVEAAELVVEADTVVLGLDEGVTFGDNVGVEIVDVDTLGVFVALNDGFGVTKGLDF